MNMNMNEYTRSTAIEVIREATSNGASVLTLDASTLGNIASWALFTKHDVTKALSEIVETLNGGASVAGWAEGENGARAAEHLLRSHQMDIAMLEALQEALWSTECVMLLTYPEDDAS